MRKFLWWFGIASFLGGLHSAATACNPPRYDSSTGVALIPCLTIDGFGSSNVSLQATGGGHFVLTGFEEYDVHNPFITSLRLLLGPTPAVLIFGNYSVGCVTAHGRPTLVRTGNHIDIQVKARSPVGVACTAALVPFVEAVALRPVFHGEDLRLLSYSVNGTPVVPTL